MKWTWGVWHVAPDGTWWAPVDGAPAMTWRAAYDAALASMKRHAPGCLARNRAAQHPGEGMTRTADNTAWAILARHRYAEETARVMHAITMQAVTSFPQHERELLESAKDLTGAAA